MSITREEKYARAVIARNKCIELAEHKKVYKYTLYPLDLGLAKLWLWWYKPTELPNSNMPS